MNIKGTNANDGGAGRPSLIGSAEEDRIFGLAADDAIIGGGGDDRIFGGTGHDRLIGGGSVEDEGRDHIQGDAGNARADRPGALTDHRRR